MESGPELIDWPRFDDYSQMLASHFSLQRDNGVLIVQMHSGGQEAKWSLELHRAFGQLLSLVGADRDNEVAILAGTGEGWLRTVNADSFGAIEATEETFRRESYDYWFRDAAQLVQGVVGLEMPTIGVVNGPGFHTEIALMCDLTICSEDAIFFDPHLSLELVPGDGQLLAFQHLIGVKRANYAVWTRQKIDAQLALEWGLVNEILPRDELIPRARSLARILMKRERPVRRLTTQVMRRPWRRLLTNDFDLHILAEMWGASLHRGVHR